MSRLIPKVQKWLGIVLVPALFYSTAISTVCISGFFILSLYKFSRIRSCPWYLWVWTLVWFQSVISGINSEHLDVWGTNVFLKLPFLIMPLAFHVLPDYSKKHIYDIHIWLFSVLWITVIPVVANFLLYHEEVINNLSLGQAISTPIHHVLYSMIMSYGLVAVAYILIYKKEYYSTFRLPLMLGCIGLFVIQHLLAIRTGLILSYLSLILVFWFSAKSKRYILLYILGLMIIAFIGIKTIPSLKQKVAYMRYDLEQFRSGQGLAYADSERLYSLQKGFHLWIKHPIMGVGIGDLQSSMAREGLDKLPHSQWIYTLAGSGIVGLFFLLLGLYIPLYQFKGELSALLLLLYVILTICLTIDFVLEHSAIVAFLNFFGLLLLTSENKFSKKRI